MKTTKSFVKRIDAIYDKLCLLQEQLEEAIAEYDEKESESGLTEKQEENREDLQNMCDEVQNAIDYLSDYTSDNF